jgi:hypothetical protein
LERVRPAEVVCCSADPVVLLEGYLERGIILCRPLILVIPVGEKAAFPPQRGFTPQAGLGET